MKRLAGAHIWAQWHPHPLGYTLWRYDGPQVQSGTIVHRFNKYDTKDAWLLLPASALLTPSFRPFLIDTGEMPHAAS